MEAAIRGTGAAGSPDDLLISRHLGRKGTYPVLPAERVFQVMGAIVYEMEWTSGDNDGGTTHPDFHNAAVLADAVDTISPDFLRRWFEMDRFFGLMISADYGFPDYALSTPSIGMLFYKENRIWAFERFCDFLAATAWR